MSARLVGGTALLLGLAVASCAGAPWFMGRPLNGQVSISPVSAKLSFAQQRIIAKRERALGRPVLELEALLALYEMQRATPPEQARLAALLERAAIDFHLRGRAVPESRNLELVARLAPARGASLTGRRAVAARDAGDVYLAVGAEAQAQAAYQLAATLGAPDIGIRLRAAAGQAPPAAASLAAMEKAIAALPLRAVPPWARAYVTHGGSDRATLEKALAAARQQHLEALVARIGDAWRVQPAAPAEPAAPTDDAAPPAPAPPAPLPPGFEDWVLRGPTLSTRLLPLIAAHPALLDDVPRARFWVDLLLVEDATSTEILEVAALAFGRAGRFGGTERMLMELAFYTPDRAAGLARGAALWERVGRGRDACAQWIRAARWRDDPEDPTWRNAITCTRRDPGAGDWRAIRQYVLDRAPADRRDAIAATLDAP